MRTIVHTLDALPTPEAVVRALQLPITNSQFSIPNPPPIPAPHFPISNLKSEISNFPILLRTALFTTPEARYSFLVANPFLTFRSHDSNCVLSGLSQPETTLFGNPWDQLQNLIARYELLDDIDLPFPLGGCFGYWGYDLKNSTEAKLPRTAVDDLELPDACLGFYSSVVVFDHQLRQTIILSTGLNADASRSETKATAELAYWQNALELALASEHEPPGRTDVSPVPLRVSPSAAPTSNMTRAQYERAVQHVLDYIHRGHIYQVNIAHRLTAPLPSTAWDLYQRLLEVSPAPFAAYLDAGDFQLASSSPERFLRLSGAHIQTRPIKGTRPRHADPARDAELAHELQTSAKEMSELVMITDLLRNDLGRVCEYGSVQTPELVRLERYPHVQHLVSTVEGRLRPEVTHLRALAQCFPGGSITGAPKIRATQIIDQLETVARGPYTGALGYIGFNRESQLSILIRTAVVKNGQAHFHVGAGIVADSDPAAEYDETLAKAAGFLQSLIPNRR